MPTFESKASLPVSAAEAFRWHTRPGAFERLAPPWERVAVVDGAGRIEDGSRVTLRIGRPPAAMRWVAVHREVEEGRRFLDVQESGPFERWVHEHRFEDRREGGSQLTDRIKFALPLGAAGELVGGAAIRRRLTRAFRYRRQVTAEDLARHAPRLGEAKPVVAITGASGMLGRQLAAFLGAGGYEIRRFARGRTARDGEIAWNPATGRLDHEGLEGIDAVVHLAGESLSA
ncbi:MAG TPA: SRPBCC family protein, partial [Candidatus Polarisedimenticolaceae bacterium]|nr:SRPBCC family protein [Candidatus Polarisedimenticolaceae bacterium]